AVRGGPAGVNDDILSHARGPNSARGELRVRPSVNSNFPQARTLRLRSQEDCVYALSPGQCHRPADNVRVATGQFTPHRATERQRDANLRLGFGNSGYVARIPRWQPRSRLTASASCGRATVMDGVAHQFIPEPHASNSVRNGVKPQLAFNRNSLNYRASRT